MKTGSITTSSLGQNYVLIFEQAEVLAPPPIQVGDEFPELKESIQRLLDAGSRYMEHFNNECLREDDMMGCCWAGQSARDDVLRLIDKEVAQGGDQATIDKLQAMFDDLNTYVRDYLKMDYEEQKAQQDAMATYQDDGMADSDASGHLVGEEQLQEAILNASARRKHATVVRTNKDGSKTYKFPIPDKAHARAALARLNQSDLSAAEKTKVKKRAYRVLGQSPSKAKESHVDEPGVDETFTALGEAEDATIGGSMDDLQLVTIGEAAKFDLAKGELEVTFIKPGLNRSGKRFYPPATIKEGVDNGLFNGLKMFVNHASLQELSQRPERSLTEWVSTVKESWTDAEGNGKARIKVVQTWFKDFLKDLQEADALGDIGLSIFATGKVKPGTIKGKATSIVEKFQSAMSIDWVTEPGAGGRVDAIWESYQPLMIKEQEINMLNSMKAEDALKEIRESRPDIFEAIRAEFTESAEAEAARAQAEADRKAQDEKIATLEAQIKESDERTAAEKAARVKAQHGQLVLEGLNATQLPTLAKDRLAKHLGEPILKEDGELDVEKVKETIASAVKDETDYMAELLKSQGKGKGITGLGESASKGEGTDTTPATPLQEAHDKVSADVAKRLGLSTETKA